MNKYDNNDIRKPINIIILIVTIIILIGIIILAFQSGTICGNWGDICIK